MRVPQGGVVGDSRAARRGARGNGREAGMMTRGSERVVLLCCLVVSIAIGTVALLMLAHASTL